MLDLPIAERELRIGARAGATYRSRWTIAAVVLFAFAILYWNFAKMGGWAATKIFFMLSGLCFLYALFAGLILTADCVSSERRDGTLGLLFLTNLKPYDLIAGNILATSLKAMYGLLAAFPILGVSFLLGGIEYAEFARICVTLVSTLIFSLSLSLFASCLSEKHLVATGRAAGILIFSAVIIPVLADAVRKVSVSPLPRWLETLSWFSPTTTLQLATSGWTVWGNPFWWSLLAINSLSAALLISSCLVLPFVWKDRGVVGGIQIRFFKCRSAQTLRGPERRDVPKTNPFFWLASRRSSESVKFLVFALCVGIAAAFVTRLNLAPLVGRTFVEFAIPTFVWSWALVVLHALLLFKFATMATSRLSEDRRLGALELLLVTPVTVRQVLWGQWLALLRQLGGPIIAVLFLHGLIFWAYLTLAGMDERIPGGAPAMLGTLLRDLRSDDHNLWVASSVCAIIVGSAIILFLDWIAVGWVGMWVALRTRRPALAPWLTLALVLLPPITVFSIGVSVGVWMGLPTGDGSYWVCVCILMGVGLGVCNALFWIAWCWFQVVRQFRKLAADRFVRRSEQSFRNGFRILLRLASAAAAIAVLVLLFYGEEKWRGLRAWRQLERDFAARGEKLLTRVAPPPPVPDAENFAAGEMLKPLFDYHFDRFGQMVWGDKAARESLMTLSLTGEERYPWRQDTNTPAANWALQKPVDLEGWQRFYRTNTIFSSLCVTGVPAGAVLQSLTLFDAELNEMEQLSRRPRCRFPLHYDEGYTAVWSHLTVLNNVAEVLTLRSVARLELGDIAGARSDVAFVFRLANTLNTGYGLYNFRVRQLMLLGTLHSIWEGLAQHRWREDDLKFFRQLLQVDLLANYPRAVREEIVATVDFWERFTASDTTFIRRLGGFPANEAMTRVFPTGWKLLNEIALFRLGDETLLPIVDPKSHRVYPSKAAGLTKAIRSSRVALDPVSRIFVPYQNQAFGDAVIQTAHSQASIDQAMIACALEQYRQAKGRFPEMLRSLEPEFLDRIPRDAITGDSFKYQPLADGSFVLYSLGWNALDDSGRTSISRQSPFLQNLSEGDWIWQYPPKM